MPPSLLLLSGPAGRAADPHLEIAVHVELQDEAVAAVLVGGPRRFPWRRAWAPRHCRRSRRCPSGRHRCRARCSARCSRLRPCICRRGNPGSAGPPQARSSLPSASNSSTEGAARQQSAPKPLTRAKPSALTGWPLASVAPGNGLFEPDLVVVQGARPVVDPDMVVPVDIEPADLPEQPAMRQRLRPGRDRQRNPASCRFWTCRRRRSA